MDIFTNNRKPFFSKLLVCIGLLLVSFSGVPVGAAELYFGAPTQEVRVGQQFEVGIFLNTDGEIVNAVEGVIRYPADRLEVAEARDGGSLLSFWVERPRRQGEGEVAFSGVVPGGYSGTRGYLFSVTLRAKMAGEAMITVSDDQVLLHDGQGTAAALRHAPLTLQIRETGIVPEFVLPADTEPPEAFVPEIAQDQSVAEGKWFLVFAAQDKGSGVARYEVKESRKQKVENRRWKIVESPYVLRDQKLHSYIFVKAVDKAGNERVVVVPPRYPLPGYADPRIWGILLGSGVIIYLLGRTIWRKYKYGIIH